MIALLVFSKKKNYVAGRPPDAQLYESI